MTSSTINRELGVRSQINDSYQAELGVLKSKNELLENKMCKIEDLAIRAINDKTSVIDKQNAKIAQLEATQQDFSNKIAELNKRLSSTLAEKEELEVRLSESSVTITLYAENLNQQNRLKLEPAKQIRT